MARRSVPLRSTRGGASRDQRPRCEERGDEIPEVYRELLAEAEAREPQGPELDRPVKRRKVGERTIPQPESAGREVHPPVTSEDVDRRIQTTYDSTASDESDMEWEEVDIQQAPLNASHNVPYSADEPLQITLDQQKDNPKRIITRRKPVTGAEKKLRLDVHKAHLLCLLAHVQIRNLWCNDDQAQGFLKQMLPRKIIAFLNPAEDKPQYTRSTTFVDGLNQASEVFARRFKVTKPGLQRAHWADDPNSLKQRVEAILSNAEVILSRDDFRKQAQTLQGSRDFGAQLFCTLLRSAAVEARLVCSLQPLFLSGATITAPKKPESQSTIFSPDGHETEERSASDATSTPPPRIRRLGQPQFTSPKTPKPSVRTGPRPSIRESPYPVFWVEAFNEAVQKWIPVDPLVTKSLAKASKFEPPASDHYNTMSYVVAFEEDASARDVTRRYAKAFNAKTRKLRVESTRNGERWWARALRFYEKPFLEDRDEAEVSELTAKTAAEPMPRNVQDFKDHPVYALERHLRRNEVIHPKRVIGQVSLGKSGSKNQKLDPVYRRTDVHACRSADGWYRLGREIKIGEQPLKRVPRNRKKFDFSDDEAAAEIPLYALFQTDIYKPPSVVQGRIPKNIYGNLDIYTPSMVPPGGVHITRPGAFQAAKILGVDYADAVVGFEFRGRHGTAIVRGVVIADEYRETLEEILSGLENERLQAELEKRSAEALGMWKHFLLKLRISERVKGYAVEGDEGADEHEGTSIGEDYADYEDPEETGGGFLLGSDQGGSSSRITPAFRESMPRSVSPAQEAGGVDPKVAEPGPENEVLGGGFIPEETPQKPDEPQSFSSVAGDTGYKYEAPSVEPSRYNLVVVPGGKTSSTDNKNPGWNTGAATVEATQSTSNNEAQKPDGDASKGSDSTSDVPIPLESSATENPNPASIEDPSKAAPSTQSQASTPEDTRRGSGSNGDGSLLSEDPEDEDAIPEWLM